MCSLHLFALALSEFYTISGWEATLCCNNLQALQMSSREHQRIKPIAACSNLHCSLRSTKNNFTGRFKYQHVAGNMDKYLLWHQLSLVQHLNCVCNTTAIGAVQEPLRQATLAPQTTATTRRCCHRSMGNQAH